ncbi:MULTISPECIES: acyltransferase [unclassified Microcoleus]|uniref:acyltransferase n=1 Tax=unclassified Microcoleus TaxID=2642155 RepID=UPI002FD72F3C
MQPPSNLPTPKKIIYLDYLRLFACLGVFACHLWVGGILPNASNVTKNLSNLAHECLGIKGDSLYRCGFDSLFLFPSNSGDHLLFNFFNFVFGLGYQAVHLFFILSGFGLTLSALLVEKKTDRIRWFGFIKKRFIRLYPSYWLILAIYLLLNFFQYNSFLGLLKTYVKGAIFLDVIPATWYIPILLQLYLLFPFLFYFLKKLSIKNFLLLSLLVKTVSSAIIITTSLLAFDKILGFGYGGLAPGGIALTRLFEFCFGMAIAKHWFTHERSVDAFTVFQKPKAIILGIFLECLGIFLSLKYTAIRFIDHDIPVGLFISDAFIGIGIFIISLNLVFLVDGLLKSKSKAWLDLISNGTYEAYLVHTIVLSYFLTLLIKPSLQFLSSTASYLIVCLLYLIILLIFSSLTLSLGCWLFNLKSYLLQKWSLLFNS